MRVLNNESVIKVFGAGANSGSENVGMNRHSGKGSQGRNNGGSVPNTPQNCVGWNIFGGLIAGSVGGAPGVVAGSIGGAVVGMGTCFNDNGANNGSGSHGSDSNCSGNDCSW